MKNNKINNKWMDKYNLLCNYYDEYGNSLVPQSFKTLDGINRDEKGVNLGFWVSEQKKIYRENKMDMERINLLKEVDFIFGKVRGEVTWEKKFMLALNYYKHYGNLQVPYTFVTQNGIDASKHGIKLGIWLHTQKQNYKENKLTDEQIKLLESIKISWHRPNIPVYWMEKFELAKAYYKHHGNLEVPRHFKTVNGYEYQEDGVNLGNWIVTQRQIIRGTCPCLLSSEQINLLDSIGMVWEVHKTTKSWIENYNIACSYYQYYKNVNVELNFKTLNGINYSEDGLNLANWIEEQRLAYLKGTLSIYQIKLLRKLGISFKHVIYEDKWMRMYKLASKYYENYHHLEIPERFKTIDGINYSDAGVCLGTWLETQRQAYKGTGKVRISCEQIKLLEDINITWYQDIYDVKFQSREITNSNIKKYKIELLNRFKSILLKYGGNALPSREELNKKYIRKLK